MVEFTIAFKDIARDEIRWNYLTAERYLYKALAHIGRNLATKNHFCTPYAKISLWAKILYLNKRKIRKMNIYVHTSCFQIIR